MSKQRRILGTYSTPQPRDPVSGLRVCYWCKGFLPPPKRSFCSDACLHQWRLRSDPAYLRECVFNRDQGICTRCGVDTIKLRKAYLAARKADIRAEDRLKALGFDPHRRTFWDADHIQPVVEDGGLCDLDGVRTVCIPCHKKLTSELRKRLASNVGS